MTAPSPSPTPDSLVLTGGTVWAGPSQIPTKGLAILIRDGRIVSLVPDDTIPAAFASARRLDVGGATILPGLVDAHGHLDGLGEALENVDLTGTTSYEEVIARIALRAAQVPEGTWILGRGWDQNDWTVKEFPTAPLLDASVPRHPVWVSRIDGHAGLANSAAMRAAGITRDTTDPAGGRVLRDASGLPSGVFVDTAESLVDSHVPPPSRAQRKARIAAAAREIAGNGLTGMHDAGADEDTISIVQELIDEQRFPIRVYLMLTDDEALLARWFARGPLVDYKDRLTVRSVKLYADGALGSRGAALLAPYTDDPTNTGLLVTTPERLTAVSTTARKAGFQVGIHAIGDRAVRNALDAFAGAGATASDRYRIEHFQVAALDDIRRLGANGVIASMQPTHATSDMPWAERRVGPERIRGAYAWRKVLDAGGRLALGSDFPVERVNPFLGIYSAVMRQDADGQPPGGWYPDESLSIAEAIRGFTLDAAYAGFQESSRGTIEPGKLADFTIVAEPLDGTTSKPLYMTRVLKTIVGGEVVYEAK